MTDEVRLLVAWEPRWETFVSNLGPALERAPGRLQVEHSKPRYGSFSASLLLHIAVVALTFSIWTSGWMRTDLRIRPPDFSHIIYYQAPRLPGVNDRGGAQEGLRGKSGGREAYSKQTIRIALGPKLVDRVVDAPHLKLPKTNAPVANLMMLGGPIAPSAPVDALQRSLKQNLMLSTATPAAPAPASPTRDLAAVPKLEMAASLVHPAADNTSRSLKQAQLEPLPMGIIQPAVENIDRSIAEAKLVAPVGAVQAEASNTSRSLVQMASLSGMTSGAAAPPPARLAASGQEGGTGKGSSAGSAQQGAAGSSTASSGEPGAGGPGGPMGIIASLHPGSTIGLPDQSLGSIAMSPRGGAAAGYGGSGGGSGIGHGTGPGSGASGSGPGAGAKGEGLGADPNAQGGISPYAGPGGAGSGNGAGGMAIRGNTVALPTFAGPSGLNPGHSKMPLGPRHNPAVIVVASPRAGGAINRYGFLKGGKVYTIYFKSEIGMAVLQYTSIAPTQAQFREELTAPEIETTEYPEGMSKIHLVVSCLIDREGAVKTVHILESSDKPQAARMVAALAKWRFRPVLRGENPVDVQAILGFNIDTN